MNKVVNRHPVELELTNFIGFFFKETSGRGPRDVKLKIMDNVLVFFVSGILSPLEKNILKSTEGKNSVLQARRLNVENGNSERMATFERIVGSKVLDHYEGWNLENDSAVGVVVFQNNIF